MNICNTSRSLKVVGRIEFASDSQGISVIFTSILRAKAINSKVIKKPFCWEFLARSLEAQFESDFQTLMSVPSQYFTIGNETKDSQDYRLGDLARLLYEADKDIVASLDQPWLLSVVTRLEKERCGWQYITGVRDMITNRENQPSI